jgi:hypothetical protein
VAERRRAGGNSLSHPDEGTPQGGVISPLLANIYLHEVLDEWFVHDVQPMLKGSANLVRFADDFVAIFARKDEAQRFLQLLPTRKRGRQRRAPWLQTQTEWVKLWRERIGFADSMLSASKDEMILKAAVKRLGEEKGWKREPW